MERRLKVSVKASNSDTADHTLTVRVYEGGELRKEASITVPASGSATLELTTDPLEHEISEIEVRGEVDNTSVSVDSGSWEAKRYLSFLVKSA